MVIYMIICLINKYHHLYYHIYNHKYNHIYIYIYIIIYLQSYIYIYIHVKLKDIYIYWFSYKYIIFIYTYIITYWHNHICIIIARDIHRGPGPATGYVAQNQKKENFVATRHCWWLMAEKNAEWWMMVEGKFDHIFDHIMMVDIW